MHKKMLNTLTLTFAFAVPSAQASLVLDGLMQGVDEVILGKKHTHPTNSISEDLESLVTSSLKISSKLFLTEEERKATSTLLKMADKNVQEAFKLAKDKNAQKQILQSIQRKAVEELFKGLPDIAPYYKWIISYEDRGIKFCIDNEALLTLFWNRWQNDSTRIPKIIDAFNFYFVNAFVNFYGSKVALQGIAYKPFDLEEKDRAELIKILKKVPRNSQAIHDAEKFYGNFLDLHQKANRIVEDMKAGSFKIPEDVTVKVTITPKK